MSLWPAILSIALMFVALWGLPIVWVLWAVKRLEKERDSDS